MRSGFQHLRMSFAENRLPLFRDMLCSPQPVLTGTQLAATLRFFVDGTLYRHMRVVKSQLTSCLDLLSVMASNAQGMRLTDLALNLRAPKSSTQRLLEHLAQQGWIEQDEATSHYRLTTRLAVLGQRYLESAGTTNIAHGLLE